VLLVVRCCAAVGPPGAPHTGIQRQAVVGWRKSAVSRVGGVGVQADATSWVIGRSA
jgi:hypothetical protein